MPWKASRKALTKATPPGPSGSARKPERSSTGREDAALTAPAYGAADRCSPELVRGRVKREPVGSLAMGEGTTPTLRMLLDARAADLPGRDRERAALMALAEDECPLVAIVHGIAGVGKSALLRAAAHDARQRGATVVLLDGRAVEPTEHGFLTALGSALGEPSRSVGEAAAALAAVPGGVVLMVDAYERLALLDFWMRVVLVPALPASVRVVLAGREFPIVWMREFGDLVRLVRLGNLERDAAREVLARAGIA